MYIQCICFFIFLILSNGFASRITSTNSQLQYNGKDVIIKGINYFGFETECGVVHGLWTNSLDFYLDFLKKEHFNALRIPISYEMSKNIDIMPDINCINYDLNPDMKNKTQVEILKLLFDKALDRNMFILLDMHTKDNLITAIAELEYIDAWLTLLPEVMHYPNILGIDLKNEPHMPETWRHWMLYIQTAIYNIDLRGYQGLYFVEGIQSSTSGWGNDFSEIKKDNALINDPRVVFSPHVYGVSVRGEMVKDDNHIDFYRWFGFLKTISSNAIVISEFGGFFKDLDLDWHMKLAAYMKKEKITSSFYWCLNPNSVDTHGILKEDWTTPNGDKLAFLTDLNPYPTNFRIKKDSNLRL